jgi:uncharacterized protein
MKIQIQTMSEEDIRAKGIDNWPIWEKEASTFDWFYDTEEQCLIIEGNAFIKINSEEIQIKAGDFIIFPAGLKCSWNIIETIRKHYNID